MKMKLVLAIIVMGITMATGKAQSGDTLAEAKKVLAELKTAQEFDSLTLKEFIKDIQKGKFLPAKTQKEILKSSIMLNMNVGVAAGSLVDLIDSLKNDSIFLRAGDIDRESTEQIMTQTSYKEIIRFLKDGNCDCGGLKKFNSGHEMTIVSEIKSPGQFDASFINDMKRAKKDAQEEMDLLISDLVDSGTISEKNQEIAVNNMIINQRNLDAIVEEMTGLLNIYAKLQKIEKKVQKKREEIKRLEAEIKELKKKCNCK